MLTRIGSPKGAIARVLAISSLVGALGCDQGDGGRGRGRRAAEGKAEALPLKRIVLYSSGVGFFERSGKVNGTATVDLEFKAEAINDLLKSMVLTDKGGGNIAAVTYESKDPVEKTLKTFSLDLADHPTLVDLLRQARGDEVEIDAPDRIAGTIVGVETRKEKAGDDELIDVDYLTLFTKEGLKRVPLRDVGRIQFAREALNQDLTRALAVLANTHVTDKKTVSLNFEGNGQRDVSVGYNLEAPIWKTSYRLVLDKGQEPMLQGWAIVENTTDEDWNDVSLTLVAGRPISFVMDLYEPLYLKRPVVEPELFASLRPQKYDQDVSVGMTLGKEVTKSRVARSRMQLEPADAPAATDSTQSSFSASAGAGEVMNGFGGGGFGAGVSPAAQGSELGKLFQYKIRDNVDLPRQKSAMLPIVHDKVKAEKVSVYDPKVHPKHPLAGIRLKNETSLHWMQGPITVFEGGAYAGDGQIDDLPPNEERLVTFAMDLDVEVAPSSKGIVDELASVKIVKGILHATRKFRREQKYAVKNSGSEVANVLIEQKLDPNWKLVTPEKPAETTRDKYRFSTSVAPGKTEELLVDEEMTQSEEVAIANLDDERIRLFVIAPVVSDKVKEALGVVADKKRKLAEVTQRLKEAKQEIESISVEQARIRQNMATLDKGSDLYRRYVKKFGEQEDQIEQLNERAQAAVKDLDQLQADLDEYLSSLLVEH